MPLEPPVTSATLPSSFLLMVVFFLQVDWGTSGKSNRMVGVGVCSRRLCGFPQIVLLPDLHGVVPENVVRRRYVEKEVRQNELQDKGSAAEHAADRRELHLHVPLDRVRHVLRSEEHTSELQSLAYLVCRLLL